MPDLITYDLMDFGPIRSMLRTHGTPQAFRRGEYFVRAGDLACRVGLVTAGGFAFSKDDCHGDVQIFSLAFSNEIISSLIMLPDRRSGFDITALCRSEVLVMEQSKFLDLLYTELGEQAWPRLIYAIACGLMERGFSYRCDSVESRYANLLARAPQVVSNMSYKAMASYLGISREHFARLRRKMEKK